MLLGGERVFGFQIGSVTIGVALAPKPGVVVVQFAYRVGCVVVGSNGGLLAAVIMVCFKDIVSRDFPLVDG